jgi:inosine/xanthosine triphosphate pyrophosphatase family protein
VKDLFHFEIRDVAVKEMLEIELEAMVIAEVAKAYSEIKVPCIVEHAGLVFDPYPHYPGGLTKPMWDTLGSEFLTETRSAGRKARARAVVAYCDGLRVETFTGETEGRIAATPAGSRDFYWDTVFQPEPGTEGGKTYAEIVADPSKGLVYKVERLSQSSKAMLKFLEFLRAAPSNGLWP